MCCIILVLLFFSTGFSISKEEQNAQLLEESYERISYTSLAGRYEDSTYVSSHKITDFSYVGSASKRNYDLANAFSDRSNYWVSQEPSTSSFHNTITISFTNPTNLEAFLISGYSSDVDGDNNKDYHGFPTKLKVYTSLNDEELTLHTIFVGTPVQPLVTTQFVFSKPVNCTKVHLEFCEVTEDNQFSSGAHCVVIKYIQLFKGLANEEIKYSALSGNFKDTDYQKVHEVTAQQEIKQTIQSIMLLMAPQVVIGFQKMPMITLFIVPYISISQKQFHCKASSLVLCTKTRIILYMLIGLFMDIQPN